MKSLNNILGTLIVIAVLALAVFSGYKWHEVTHPTEFVTDTITIVDTLTHTIVKDSISYSETIDTLYVPADTFFVDIDTMAILKDYYARYGYSREYKDSLIQVDFYDIVSQNKIVASTFLNYKILRPQTIITNTYMDYSRYISIGANSDLDLEYFNLDLTYTTNNFNYKLLYYPRQKAFGLGISYNILKLKK
jgi:hypothetical protein